MDSVLLQHKRYNRLNCYRSFRSTATSKPKFIAYFVNPTSLCILMFFIIFNPSKLLLGENVVDKPNGIYLGYWRMFLR